MCEASLKLWSATDDDYLLREYAISFLREQAKRIRGSSLRDTVIKGGKPEGLAVYSTPKYVHFTDWRGVGRVLRDNTEALKKAREGLLAELNR